MNGSPRLQIHLDMPYKQQPRENSRVRILLDRGYRIVDVQRISDREAVVTLDPPSPPPAA